MSSLHEFIVIDGIECDLGSFDPSRTEDMVYLEDDFLDYIRDSLDWMPTYNPSMHEKQIGLNFCGETVILNDSAAQAARVFGAWHILLSCGPRALQLTGRYSWIVDKPLESGAYNVLNFNRYETLFQLEKLVRFCWLVEQNGGNKSLYHRVL
jgi:hypothetical protein